MNSGSGFQMIRSFEISNFKCFKQLQVQDCKRFNIIVGDNGAGKTALLEAVFLALSGNPGVSLRFRVQRGSDSQPAYTGSPKLIEEALWRDLFYEAEWSKPIAISLEGDGPEKRSLRMQRGKISAETLIPFDGVSDGSASANAPIEFEWIDAAGRSHTYQGRVGLDGVQLGVQEEHLPDYYFFAANNMGSAVENASRFSTLSIESREKSFVQIFTKEFPWIENLSIEAAAGVPAIHASIKGSARKIPIYNVSSGISRTLAIMLSLADRPKSVLLIDEMENGIFHEHKASLWRSILDLARNQNAQMFLSTHDEEWLTALIDAAQSKLSDIALWRVERNADNSRSIHRFEGEDIQAAIEYGSDVR